MQKGPTGYPPTGPENLDMKWRLLYWLLMQGLGVVVMAVGLYVLYQERREERRQASTCNERLMELNAEQVNLIRELRDYIKNPPAPAVKTRTR
jgi:predicted permease